MAEQSTERVTPDTIGQVSANLDAYIEARAARMAEAALARAKTEADRRVNAIRAELDDAVAELEEERLTSGTLRLNRDQLGGQLAEVTRAWRKDIATVEQVRGEAERWARSGSPVHAQVARRLLGIVGPVTAEPGTPPAEPGTYPGDEGIAP